MTTGPRRVGAYAKLLANYAADDALIEAGEAAELLFVRGLAFCATSDADGYITDAQVVRYVGAGMRDALKRAERLVQVGVWVRVDGGFLVRSWLKIHESSEQKGRRRRADRERKAKEAVRPDSVRASTRIPDGIQPESATESLSLIHDTAGHDTARQTSTSEREQRREPDRAGSVTEHTPATPTDARCTKHTGDPDPGPCNGCRAARERAERQAARHAEKLARETEAAARACTRCDGNWVTDEQGRPTRHRCDHRRAS